MSRKSILFISTQLPFPPKSGGTIKSWNYLNNLVEKYEVGLACLLKDHDADYLEDFKKKLTLKHFVNQALVVGRNPLNLLRSYLGFPCLNVYRNYSASFKKKVASIADQYDAILVDHYEVFQYVPSNYRGKVILHTHNAEFELWQRMAELTHNPLMKLAVQLESKRVLRYERKIIQRADLSYATPSDIESYQKQGISTEKIHVTYHLGNDDLLNLEAMAFEKTEESLLFMGTLSWEPNIDGILWFIEEVYPLIQKKQPTVQLYVLGKAGDDRLEKASKNRKGIQLCGFVEDLDSYLKKSRVFIAPLRFGSGMKVKVLEGMYRGIPIVTTEVGAEGMEVKAGEDLLIAKDAREFAEKCLQLLEDPILWNTLSVQSRKKAAELYTWQPLFLQMNLALDKVFE